MAMAWTQQVGLLLAFFVVISNSTAFSQEEEENEVSVQPRFSLHVGSLLPNQIRGVTEIQPVWGIRYGFPNGKKSLIEVGFGYSQAEGVQLLDSFARIRGDFPVEDLLMMAYVGGDIWYYSPEEEEFKVDFGAHFGGGFIAHIASNVAFRSDMKFQLNPGTSLYIGFGFEILLDGGKDKDDK